MSLFSKKEKITTHDFCTRYYEEHVFAPDIAGSDPWELFIETSHEMIAMEDSNFRNVKISVFADEVLALRLEVIGLAWSHNLSDTIAINQSEFTRQYLKDRDDEILWDYMGDYNQAVARSTMSGLDPNSQAGHAQITSQNSMRADLFEEYVSKGLDGTVVARALNRLGSERTWKSNMTHSYLSFKLTDRLSQGISEGARWVLISLIKGFYDGACESLASVNITG
ncbi:hypothetical protein JYT16_00355 [Gemmatimonas aurantiaca]|nr:hypothetical protein [Gemmatimonas aurantiaca]